MGKYIIITLKGRSYVCNKISPLPVYIHLHLHFVLGIGIFRGNMFQNKINKQTGAPLNRGGLNTSLKI